MSYEHLDDNEQGESEPGPSGSSGPSIWLILFALVAIATAVFIVQNGQEVETEFLWLDGQFKFWMSILASILLGVLLDRLILTWWRRARRRDD